MSVLIKGVEMPTRCFACSMCDVENEEVNCAVPHGSYIEYREVYPKVAIQERPSDCPLIEVPPHGRLIDADALKAKMYHDAFETDSPLQKWDGGCWIRYKMFEDNLENAPTVIPTDKEGET